jgi:hypothetical protein
VAVAAAILLLVNAVVAFAMVLVGILIGKKKEEKKDELS